jgi:hypothetical protein
MNNYHSTGGAASRVMAYVFCGDAFRVDDMFCLFGGIDAPELMPAGSVEARSTRNAAGEIVARPSLTQRDATK